MTSKSPPTLRSVIEHLPEYSDDLTIYATRPWNADSNVWLGSEQEIADFASHLDERYAYLLEVGIAKEVVTVWQQWRGGRRASADEACAAVIYYAMNDAYLPSD